MVTEQQHTDDTGAPQGGDELQKKIDEFLADLATRMALLQKLSGHTPVCFPLTPAPGFPPFWGRHADATMAQSTPQRASEAGATNATSPGVTGNDLSSNNEDIIEPLGVVEALELVEFNPTVEPEGKWTPPQPVLAYLKKHFTKSLDQAELNKVVKEFPKPQCSFLETPMLDDQVRDHLKKKWKDPHFGAEKTLYRLQGSVLNLTGPLTGLWTDLTRRSAKRK